MACPQGALFRLKFYTLEHIFNLELRSVISTHPAPRNA